MRISKLILKLDNNYFLIYWIIYSIPGMVAHSFNLCTQEAEAVLISEFKANLVYIVSFGVSQNMGYMWDTVSEKINEFIPIRFNMLCSFKFSLLRTFPGWL